MRSRNFRNACALQVDSWFKAKGTISAGAVEGLNNKAKLITRKAYGYRSARVLELALYHALGKLPEPKTAHRFC